jgi:hypothetical protein
MSLILPNIPPRKKSVVMGNKNIVVRSDIKQPSLGRYPIKFVFTTLSQFDGIQQIKERGKEIHLPIMSHFEKINIPLIRVTQKHQIVCHGGILISSQTKQVRKSCLEDLIPKHIMSKPNFFIFYF